MFLRELSVASVCMSEDQDEIVSVAGTRIDIRKIVLILYLRKPW